MNKQTTTNRRAWLNGPGTGFPLPLAILRFLLPLALLPGRQD